MIHVLGQRDEGMFIVDATAAPGLGYRLEGADHELARIFLEIGAFIGHAHHRHIARQIGDRFRNDIEMLARVERNIDADGAAEFARPHAAMPPPPCRP